MVVRPSIVFGPEDDFFNRFGALARISPALPLPGGGHTRFQLVYAGDVAQAIALAVDGSTKKGTIYELGGPDVHTFRELMEFVLATIHRRRLLISVPFGVMRLQAGFAQFLPKPPITPDQVEMLKRDNVVSDEARREGRTLEGLESFRKRSRRSCRLIFGASAKPANSIQTRVSRSAGAALPPPRPIARVGTWPQNACSFRNEILTVRIFDPILGRGGPPHMLATAC